MLKPDVIKNKEFEQSVLGGYRRDEVDRFLDEVEADYRKLYQENEEMMDKLKVCLAKIENYRKDEEFLKTAIINAQKLNDTAVKEIELKEKEAEITSKEKAAQIIAEAEKNAKDIVEKAETESADAIKAAQESCKREIAEERAAADKAIRAIHAEKEAEQKKLDYLKSEVSSFRSTILDIYKAHLTAISKLPEFKPAEAEPEKTAEPAPEKKTYEEPIKAEDPAPAEEAQEEPASDPSESTTMEFYIHETPKEPEKKDLSSQRRFENLKFGVDYDINNDN